MTLQIYHNPHCSKSRETLALLKNKGLKPEIIEYLKTPPTEQELKNLLLMLKMEAKEIVRKKEELYKTLELDNKNLNQNEWIQILLDHPTLMERPIVVYASKASLGRPPEKILEIL